MPFGSYDPEGKSYFEFKEKKISVIVLLAEDNECLLKAGRNLRSLYLQEGFKVIYLPVRDFSIPSTEELEDYKSALEITCELARRGHHIAIHCSAGIGRTGMFAACLAKKIFSLSGEEAINWIRQYIPGAVETPEQKHLVIYLQVG